MRSGSDDPPAGRPRYVQLRKGRWFWEPPARLRRAFGLNNRALGADQAKAFEMAREFNRRLDAAPTSAGQPGTVRWLFDQFAASETHARLAESTRGDYRWLANLLCRLDMNGRPLGAFGARSITPMRADAIYAVIKRQSGHSSAHYACRFARRVWKWAGRREMVLRDNPWTGMELASIPQRDVLWTQAQVAAVKAKATELGRPSVALAISLAYWLGHRQGDVLTLTWRALHDRRRRTRKTQAQVVLVPSAYPELAEEIATEEARQAALPAHPTHVVICETTGRPWLEDHFRHEFRRIANEARIPPELQFRDLRATAATELSDAGADIIGMSTHTSHRTAQMARRYARPTETQFESAAAKRMAARKNET